MEEQRKKNDELSKEIGNQKAELNSIKVRLKKLEVGQANLQTSVDENNTRLQNIDDQLYNLSVIRETD